jgi:hypothetical protein
MPIIRRTISEYVLLLGGHAWKVAWVVLRWASWSEHCSEDVEINKNCILCRI